jgi:hypothetical protein
MLQFENRLTFIKKVHYFNILYLIPLRQLTAEFWRPYRGISEGSRGIAAERLALSGGKLLRDHTHHRHSRENGNDDKRLNSY